MYPDLSLITLKKRGHFQFLTTNLRSKEIKYRWGFPFTFLFEFQDRLIVICTVKEAEDFLDKYKSVFS